jgi:hypothetical protein
VVEGIAIGHEQPVRVIADPCSVESFDQFRKTAIAVNQAGALLLRGGSLSVPGGEVSTGSTRSRPGPDASTLPKSIKRRTAPGCPPLYLLEIGLTEASA